MENKEKPERVRKFGLITYAERKQIEEFITAEEPKLNESAYILHDKDEAEPHWHIALNYINATTFENVKTKLQKFNGNQTVLEKEVKSWNGLIAYLTHEDTPGKHHYDKTEVVYKARDKPNIWLSMYIDFVENKLAVKKMIQKYGKDFVINMRNFRDLRTETYEENERYARMQNLKLKELNEDEAQQLETKLNFKGDN